MCSCFPFQKPKCVYLLTTELLPWDPSEQAHLYWGSHALPFYCPTHGQIPAQNRCAVLKLFLIARLSRLLIRGFLPLKSERQPFKTHIGFYQAYTILPSKLSLHC